MYIQNSFSLSESNNLVYKTWKEEALAQVGIPPVHTGHLECSLSSQLQPLHNVQVFLPHLDERQSVPENVRTKHKNFIWIGHLIVVETDSASADCFKARTENTHYDS